MKKTKATVATMIIAILVAAITACLYFLLKPGFVAVAGILGVYGFFSGASDFKRWLHREDDTPLIPAEVTAQPETVIGELDWEKEPTVNSEFLEAVLDEYRNKESAATPKA